MFHLWNSISSGTVLHDARDTTSPKILEFPLDALPICALGFFIAPAVSQRIEIFRDKCATLYTDNATSFGDILSAGSSSASVSSITLRFWFLVDQFPNRLRMGRVSSTANVADLPTSDKEPTFVS